MQDTKRLKFLIEKAASIYGSDNKLAIHLGVTRQQISKWKNGHQDPSIEMQERLAEIAGLDPAVQVMAAAIEKTGHKGALALIAPFRQAWLFSSLAKRLRGRLSRQAGRES